MSVLSYLEQRASGAILSTNEDLSIARSIDTLRSRISAYFGTNVVEQYRFGSSTRGTILPRRDDPGSDIDYMVVFGEGGVRPQAFLDRLRRFAGSNYGRSEIYQSSPTMVLELAHIRFELVPAYKDFWSGLQIPDGRGGWMGTDPFGFKKTLEAANVANSCLLKPAIRLLKLWNVQAGGVFPSFELECWITGRWYFGCTNLKGYVFNIIDGFADYHGAQWKSEAVARAKRLVREIREWEQQGYLTTAEQVARKLFQ